MNRGIGPALRLVGPLLQIASLLLLFSGRGGGRPLAGFPVEALAYGGFAMGFLLVAAGLALSRPPSHHHRD